jgi:hypothetical protein
MHVAMLVCDLVDQLGNGSKQAGVLLSRILSTVGGPRNPTFVARFLVCLVFHTKDLLVKMSSIYITEPNTHGKVRALVAGCASSKLCFI